ncbi:hypothetical protein ACRYCC_26125 [Actinomadura scrupuli]|uniref:hypothetical protein n=1 Tax=Actinomadura scrupuli TaxID=559629 RepID=UPI003D9985DE
MGTDQAPNAATATNAELAAHARQLADEHPGDSLPRKAALCVAVCLQSTTTTDAARRILPQIRIRTVRDAATELFDRLTTATP